MKKRIQLLFSILGLTSITALSNTYITSCSKGDMKTIKWTIDNGAHIEVIGKKKLPEEIANGKELKFKVNLDNGISLLRITINGKVPGTDKGPAAPIDGVYTINVVSNVLVIVKVIKEVKSLEVTKMPDKLVYYAGDKLDVTGMKVKAEYVNGEVVDNLPRSSKGYKTNLTRFKGGEYEFKITFGDKEAVIPLAQQVRYLFSIDPDGGKISDNWKNKYKDNSTIK